MIIAGQHYRVIWLHGTPDEMGHPEMGEADEGYCDFDSGTIYIRVAASSSRNHGTLVHEILHAALDSSGAEYLLTTLADKANLDRDETVELFIRMLAPALVNVMHVSLVE